MKRFALVLALAYILMIFATGCGAPAADKSAEQVPDDLQYQTASVDTSADVEQEQKEASADKDTTDDAVNEPEDSTEDETSAEDAAKAEAEAAAAEEAARLEAEKLEQQKNSIAMLNYLTLVSSDILNSNDNSVLLKESFNTLLSNLKPEKVDEITASYLEKLLDSITTLSLTNIKRDRLQYLYDQYSARAWKAAIPDMDTVLNIINSTNPIQSINSTDSTTAVINAFIDILKLKISISTLALNCANNYEEYIYDLAIENQQENWQLDDKDSKTLSDMQIKALSYRNKIVSEYKLSGALTINPNEVNSYVNSINDTTATADNKLQFLLDNQDTYQTFGNYWLDLADCYYELDEFEECLKSIDTYLEVQADIFEKDHYLAQALPKAIAAASKIYNDEEYVLVANRYLKLLVDNIENEEWSLRYFAAQIYVELYAITSNDYYIEKAFEYLRTNINYLAKNQKNANSDYESISEKEAPKNAKKEEKKSVKEHNNSLLKELPPVYEPLVLNCDLLFAISDKCNLSSSEINRINGILKSPFISEVLNSKYSFDTAMPSFEAELAKDTLILPVTAVTENSRIEVTVTSGGVTSIYDDWIVEAVDRTGKVENFKATYKSEDIKDQKWSEDTTVKVEIFTNRTDETADVVLNFKVSNYKKLVGIQFKIEFEQVK